MYFVLIIFILVIMLFFLNFVVFILFIESGECIGYLIMCLLLLVVFLILIFEVLLKMLDLLFMLFCFFMFLVMIFVGISLLMIIIVWLYYKNDKFLMLMYLKKFIYCLLCRGCKIWDVNDNRKSFVCREIFVENISEDFKIKVLKKF